MSAKLVLVLAALPLAAGLLSVNAHEEKACVAEDLKRRAQLQNKLAGICEDMCKEVQAYPKCKCPDFVEPDSTPGVMTWDELLEYMDQLAQWGRDSIKGWHKQASQLQVAKNDPADAPTCSVKSDLNIVLNTSPYNAQPGEYTLSGAGKVNKFDMACPVGSAKLPETADEVISHGGASENTTFKCAGACCIKWCCGTGECFSETLIAKNATVAKNATLAKTAAKKTICLASDLYYSTAPGTGGEDFDSEKKAIDGMVEGECHKLTGATAMKLCGTETVEVYDAPDCDAGTGTKKTLATVSSGVSGDCGPAEWQASNIVSFKYTCPAGMR